MSETTHPLLVLQLAGSQADMGRQHGELVRQRGGHEATLDYYPRLPERVLGQGRGRAERVAIGALKPAFSWALHRLEQLRPPDLRDRTRAFATAMGRPAHEARFLSVMDVFQNTVGMLARCGLMGPARRVALAIPPACSSLAAWDQATTDGRLLHGRNFDFPGIGVWERQPVLAFCTPTGGLRYGFTSTRGADIPGVTAFNEAGLTVTAHTRFHRDVGFGAAVIDVTHDIIRKARTLDHAIRIARSRALASTWGLVVTSGAERSAIVIETTAAGVEISHPRAGESFLACTNHYLHPALQVDEVSPSPAWLNHCVSRYAVLRGRGRAGQIDVRAMQELLGSHLDAETGEERGAGGVIAQPTTVQSIVSDPERQAIHLSVGECPSGRNSFTEIPWGWEDAPGSTLVQPAAGSAHPSRYASGAAATGHQHFRQACALDERGAPLSAVEAEMLAAVAADPTDPSWRFIAGSLRLRHGASGDALAHYETGLAHERSAFYRGQLLLWGSRAAQDLGDETRARSLRRELLEMPHPLLASHRASAVAEGRRPPRRGAWKGTPVTLELMDAG